MFQIRFPGVERLRPRSTTWLYGIWIVLAIAGSAVAWWLVQAGIERDRFNSEQDARRAVRAYATAYEQYLSRSLSQVEQVAAQLRHAWEQAGGDFDLQVFRSEGLLVGSAVTEAAILDRHGRVVASVPGRTRASVGPDDPALAHHRSNNSSAALISGLPGDAAPRQRRLRMTLRLETRDSEFAGMVALVVDADFLTRDFNMGVLGRHGLVAAMLDGGGVRLEGHGSSTGGSLFSMAPALAADAGETQLDGTHFSDGIARLVAWRRSSVYPIVALAAERTDDIYAAVSGEADAMWRRWFLASCAGATIAVLLVAITHHMLRRRAGEEEIRSAYRAATENAKEGFYMAKAVRDAGGRVIDFVIADCNGRGAAIYSATPEELIGRRLSEIEGDANGGSIEPYLSAMRNGIYEDERQMPNGRRMKITWGKRRVVRVGDGLAFTLQDISERKAFESELSWLANHDALTGLPSRAWVTRFVPRAIEEAAGKGHALAVLLIDLDDFRHVNDTHGHAVGDELLKQAALRLGAAVRPQDVVGRFGGDEFVVLLDKCGTDAELAATAARLACAMSRTYEIGAAYHTIGASIGISRYPRDGADAPTLIRHADIAMSAAKRDRHDHVRLFDVALFREVTERASLRQNLQQALPRRQFSLHYQPRVDLATGRVCSMEALLRWHHPELGMVAPAKFIPVAEECGLIAAIGEFVVEQACRQLALWRAAGVDIVPLSINVSAHQLEEGGVHAHLALHLARHHLPVAMVEVEVTESAMVGEGGRVQEELSALRTLGVRLHVDDFGTGYSSLAQLQRLEMDVLKIDRAFTAELTLSGEGHALVQAIVSMAKALGMGVVAEGVETPCQLAALQALACDEAQGYLFAAPLPPAEAESLLRRGNVMPGFAEIGNRLAFEKL